VAPTLAPIGRPPVRLQGSARVGSSKVAVEEEREVQNKMAPPLCVYGSDPSWRRVEASSSAAGSPGAAVYGLPRRPLFSTSPDRRLLRHCWLAGPPSTAFLTGHDRRPATRSARSASALLLTDTALSRGTSRATSPATLQADDDYKMHSGTSTSGQPLHQLALSTITLETHGKFMNNEISHPPPYPSSANATFRLLSELIFCCS
jgi:hypothetical protein